MSKVLKSADGHEIKKGRLFWCILFYHSEGPLVHRAKIRNVDYCGHVVLDEKVYKIIGYRGIGHNHYYVTDPEYLYHSEEVARAAIEVYFEGLRFSLTEREKKAKRRFASEKRRVRNKRKGS